MIMHKTYIVTCQLRQDCSDEGSQHMVSMRNKKTQPHLASNTLSYLQPCENFKKIDSKIIN